MKTAEEIKAIAYARANAGSMQLLCEPIDEVVAERDAAIRKAEQLHDDFSTACDGIEGLRQQRDAALARVTAHKETLALQKASYEREIAIDRARADAAELNAARYMHWKSAYLRNYVEHNPMWEELMRAETPDQVDAVLDAARGATE